MIESPPRRPRPAVPELAAGYYVRNFETVLRTVSGRDGDLLNEAEQRLADAFFDLGEPARRLYVRLIGRKGPLFRPDRLDYPEIDDLEQAARDLRSAGLLDEAADADLEALVTTLRQPELRALGRDERLAADAEGRPLGRLRRAELIEALVAGLGPDRLEAAIRRKYRFWRPLGQAELVTFRLLFFGNLRQGWSEFVVRDLGIVRYEAYELRRELRLFDCRQALDHCLLLGLARRQVSDWLAAGEIESATAVARAVLRGPRHWLAPSSDGSAFEEPGSLAKTTAKDEDFDPPTVADAVPSPEIDSWHATARRHADRILVRVGRALERLGALEAALGLYEAAERPPARERRCRVLDALERREEALDLCTAVAAEPIDETERAFVRPFAHRLERRLGRRSDPYRRRRRPTAKLELPHPERVAAEAAELADPGSDAAEVPGPGSEGEVGESSVFTSQGDLLRRSGSVEWRALAAFEARGRSGIYSENWLWRGLFGLAFWDIVFAPVPGAFQHPFQLGPLDLFGPEFRHHRRAAVATRLEELRAETDLLGRLWPVFEAKMGIANSLVPWHEVFHDQIRLALERLPGWALATVCDRLSRDPGRYRRGFPDLLLFAEPGATDDDSPGGFELLEVKAPGDQLRAEQKGWIDYLGDQGIRARVLAVHWSR